jgi:predicted permease
MNWGTNVSVQGFERGPDTDVHAFFNEVSPGFFRTLGIPLLSGREFTAADASKAPQVVIVNEAFARKFNLGRDGVGKRMSTGGRALDLEIVGIVQDAKYSDVRQEPFPTFFRPSRQGEMMATFNMYVRTSADPDQVFRAAPGVLARLDPNLPLENLKTLPQQVRENVFLDRIVSTLAAAFAVLATLLAAVGLYGVLAYTVSQRTREIGLRMAFGADAGRMRSMILMQVAWMTLVGGAIGVAGAHYLGKGAKSLLFELEPNDPAVTAVSIAVLSIVAFAAGYIPAHRASRVDPMQALRYE